MTIVLAWPDKVLSPNSRVHWSKRAAATKAARTAAFYLTRAAVTIKPTWDRVRLSVTFCPPNARRRDLDNCIASCKGIFDGISDALGIDDSRFEPSFRMSSPVKGGAVRVEITPIQVTES